MGEPTACLPSGGHCYIILASLNKSSDKRIMSTSTPGRYPNQYLHVRSLASLVTWSLMQMRVMQEVFF